VKRATIALSLLTTTLIAAAAACSSSSSSKSSGGGNDSGADVAVADTSVADVVATDTLIVDPNNCVASGTASNAEGVGGYCSPGGGQCDTAGPGGSPTLCSADYGAPAHGWFCTYPCAGPAACGTGMLCVSTAAGAGCVPPACLSLEPDGGYQILDGGEAGPAPSEGGTEAGSADAPTDSPSGDAAGE
jgi:hypothetical protein